jgi:hypothetical protein
LLSGNGPKTRRWKVIGIDEEEEEEEVLYLMLGFY